MAAKFIAVLRVLLEDHIDQNSAQVRNFFFTLNMSNILLLKIFLAKPAPIVLVKCLTRQECRQECQNVAKK